MKPLNTKSSFLKNLHLLLSAFVILVVGLVYGLYPSKILPGLFHFNIETANLHQVFRGIMGLYSGMAILWITGIIKPAYWTTATLSNIIFMGGLATGRLLSLLLDGIPSYYFVTGLLFELVLLFWGIYNLNRHSSNRKN